jgi:hypothetical protein
VQFATGSVHLQKTAKIDISNLQCLYQEVTGEWRKLHNEELLDLYSSPSIIRIIKSRRMNWAGHVARMGRRGTLIDYWWGARGKETTRKIKVLVDG